MSDVLSPGPSPDEFAPDESGTSIHDPSEEPVGGAESVPDPSTAEPTEPSDDDLGIER